MGEIRQAMNLAAAQLHMQEAVEINHQYQADKMVAERILAKLPSLIEKAVRMGKNYVNIYGDCQFQGVNETVGELIGVPKILVSMLILHEDCTIEDFVLQNDGTMTSPSFTLFVGF